MHKIRKNLLVTPVALLLVGCLSPATLRPVAEDNTKNISNYTSNVSQLVVMYGQMLEPLLDIRYALAQQRLLDVVRKYETAAGNIDQSTFTKNVANLQPSVQQIASIQDEVKRSLAQEAFLRSSPIVADVALARISENDAIALMDLYIQVSNDVPSSQIAILEVVSQRFFITSDTALLHSQIRQAFLDFSDLLNKQASLASQHSEAFKQFSNSNLSFASVVSVLTSDSVKTTIAELVSTRRGDPNRKKEVETALTELNDLGTVTNK